MLDEVDKLGRDFGRSLSGLMEVLDPRAERSQFRDHYLECHLTVCPRFSSWHGQRITHTGTIARPQWKFSRLPGYTAEEKIHIAKPVS